MFESHVDASMGCRGNGAEQSAAALRACEELRAHFRRKYPMLLDGALVGRAERARLSWQARVSLAAGRVDPALLPAAVLCDALARISAEPVKAGQAGLVPIGPNAARVWWDDAVLDNLNDILAQLERPSAVLRFYDITGLGPDAGRWHESFDVDIDVKECGRTVPLWSSDREYVVDLGYVHADGRFLSLARTNAVRLPRERSEAAAGAKTVESALRRRGARAGEEMTPDAEARLWSGNRRDFPERDLDAELIVHMLYRAFLDEGPRALRRLPRLVREDGATRRQQFEQRQRGRRRTAAVRDAVPAVLAMRLDAAENRVAVAPSRLRYYPVPAVVGRISAAGVDMFGWLESLLALARHGARPTAVPEPELVRRVELDEAMSPMSRFANSVFEAARNLRNGMAAMEPVSAEPIESGADVSEALTAGALDRFEALPPFGGVEAKRLAKAGVRITRMALTLEGRMRPGARLKVAGRLVHADAQGRFQLECVLSGKRASIPVRAGTSIEGEARGTINVDWEKRPASERRRVLQGMPE